jgi:hypothetical protein
MKLRTRTLVLASLAVIPCLALAHNGRDGAPPPLDKWSRGMAQAKQAPAPQGESQVGKFVDIYQGIVVKVDPKTGVRSYVQVGDAAANPARARVSADTNGPGVAYWVNKEFESRPSSAPAEPAYAYEEPAPQISSYDEGYYGGYLPYGYGGYGYGGRPGGGHGGGGGDGDGGRPGHGGGGNPPPHTGWGINEQPYRPSPPPGPYGGGVGSPTPYPFNDRGVGAPSSPRYSGIRRR